MATKTILTIAGFDPSSGAGVTADLAVIASHGYFGTAAITALTVQSTERVRAVHAVEPAVLAETLECLVADIEPDGVKIGMLASEGNAGVVLDFLRKLGRKVPVVLDTVVRSSSGKRLLSCAGYQTLQEELLPLVDWITPNLAELGMLSGVEVSTPANMEEGVDALRGRFPALGLVATGGHLEVPDDLLCGADGIKVWLRGERVESRSTHGTGCAFSTAMLCGLVDGRGGVEAARQAKAFVTEGIRRAPGVGKGRGPLELRWPLLEKGQR
jgi:hydroxymethylpyrimidine/phosphomethylpyrimidine kinase